MIKFLDLKKINSKFESEFKDYFNSFLNTGHYILGKQVTEFETQFAAYCGTKHCVGVSSGLDALILILEGYKVMGVFKQGDEIMVPANTYIATILAITNAGLTPVLIEPESRSYNINTKLIKPHITPKTKAILGVHLYGAIYNVNHLEQLCKDHDLLLIEDAAQAHGAVAIDGRKAGNLSHAAAFSFYPTKNLGALGDAGAITTNNTALANIFTPFNIFTRASFPNNTSFAAMLLIPINLFLIKNQCKRYTFKQQCHYADVLKSEEN